MMLSTEVFKQISSSFLLMTKIIVSLENDKFFQKNPSNHNECPCDKIIVLLHGFEFILY